MRLSLAALLTSVALLSTPALAGGLEDMTPAERTAFQAEVKAYLLANPEVIVDAMGVLQSREDSAAASRDQQILTDNKALIFNDAASWVGGNPDGDVTVVEFMDYRCGYCRKAYTEVEELVKSDGNIRFVPKEFPILGDEPVAASRLALAVLPLHGADAHNKAHDGLINLRGAPDAETLGRLATDMGLEPEAILTHMASDDVTKVIAANHALADVMQISGTPTFVIDDTLLRGYVPLDGLRQIVAGERS